MKVLQFIRDTKQFTLALLLLLRHWSSMVYSTPCITIIILNECTGGLVVWGHGGLPILCMCTSTLDLPTPSIYTGPSHYNVLWVSKRFHLTLYKLCRIDVNALLVRLTTPRSIYVFIRLQIAVFLSISPNTFIIFIFTKIEWNYFEQAKTFQ